MCDVYVGKLFQFSTKWIKQSLRLSTKKLQTLAQVVLKSPSFRNFKATRIYNFLKAYVDERPRPDAEEVVAFALICVDRSATEEPRASSGRSCRQRTHVFRFCTPATRHCSGNLCGNSSQPHQGEYLYSVNHFEPVY